MNLRPFVDSARLPLRLLVVVAIFVVAGCGILDPAKKKGGGDGGLQYLDLKTPEHVMQNLSLAWHNRDSSETAQLYTSDYIGTSTDVTDNSTLEFTRDVEVSVVGGLRRTASITSVNLVIPPESTWTHTTYEGDPASWRAIQFPAGSVIVQVYDPGGDWEARSSTFLEFKFRPVNVSGTDTTWGIVRWKEVAASVQK
jgi:hypothetical protein